MWFQWWDREKARQSLQLSTDMHCTYWIKWTEECDSPPMWEKEIAARYDNHMHAHMLHLVLQRREHWCTLTIISLCFIISCDSANLQELYHDDGAWGLWQFQFKGMFLLSYYFTTQWYIPSFHACMNTSDSCMLLTQYNLCKCHTLPYNQKTCTCTCVLVYLSSPHAVWSIHVQHTYIQCIYSASCKIRIVKAYK